MFFIGIDPGQKGGIAVLGEDMHICQLLPFSEVNMRDVASWYEGDSITVLEKVGAMPHQGVVSMFNFGKGYGYILGVLETSRMPYQLVNPKTWQKEFSIHSKEDSVATAKRLFPDANLKPTERSRKDSDGLSDALLMAAWCYRNYSRK